MVALLERICTESPESEALGKLMIEMSELEQKHKEFTTWAVRFGYATDDYAEKAKRRKASGQK